MFYIHEKCQIQSIFIFFRIESFCCCFSVIRYGPTGVTLSARETLTACALVWLSAEDSKALCFYLIWGTVWFYSRVYRPVWSIRIISCADSILRLQSFYFANSRFFPSHITTSIQQTRFLRANSRWYSGAGCYFSVGLKKTLHWPTPLTSCEGYRWKHCLSQDRLSRSISFIYKWLFYIQMHQTDIFSCYVASNSFFSILRHECRI